MNDLDLVSLVKNAHATITFSFNGPGCTVAGNGFACELTAEGLDKLAAGIETRIKVFVRERTVLALEQQALNGLGVRGPRQTARLEALRGDIKGLNNKIGALTRNGALASAHACAVRLNAFYQHSNVGSQVLAAILVLLLLFLPFSFFFHFFFFLFFRWALINAIVQGNDVVENGVKGVGVVTLLPALQKVATLVLNQSDHVQMDGDFAGVYTQHLLKESADLHDPGMLALAVAGAVLEQLKTGDKLSVLREVRGGFFKKILVSDIH